MATADSDVSTTSTSKILLFLLFLFIVVFVGGFIIYLGMNNSSTSGNTSIKPKTNMRRRIR